MNADQRGSCHVTLSLFRTVVNPSELVLMPVAAREGGVGPDEAGRANTAAVFVPTRPSL